MSFDNAAKPFENVGTDGGEMNVEPGSATVTLPSFAAAAGITGGAIAFNPSTSPAAAHAFKVTTGKTGPGWTFCGMLYFTKMATAWGTCKLEIVPTCEELCVTLEHAPLNETNAPSMLRLVTDIADFRLSGDGGNMYVIDSHTRISTHDAGVMPDYTPPLNTRCTLLRFRLRQGRSRRAG